MRTFFISALLLFVYFNSFAQQGKLYPFTINGTINADTGKVQLQLVNDTSFYPKQIRQMETRVVKGKFSFSGVLPYPIGIGLNYNHNQYFSAGFVIEKGAQHVVCNIDSNNKVPMVDNQVMQELGTYQNAFKAYNIKYAELGLRWKKLKADYQNNIPENLKLDWQNELKADYALHDSILMNYVNSHPNSYLAFWNFVRLTVFGYENIFDHVFTDFSATIKNSYPGRALATRLKIIGTMAIGKKYTYVKGVSTTGKLLKPNFYKGNKYTLVDFWYSDCSPCRAQFPDLRNVYQTYKYNGFEIIGISTDHTKFKQNWENVIVSEKLAWPQYLDLNGLESSKVYINVFPTNFLLDNNGIIIKHDISPAELADFLKKNLR